MTSAPSDPQQLGPVQSPERILLLDVLRAVAILGMFYANWIGIYHPDIRSQGVEGVQAAVSFFTGWFVHGKFWPLFALLMGVGMAVQIERAEARGVPIVPVYLRRLAFLFVLAWIGSLFLRVGHLELLAVSGFVAFFIAFTLRRHRALLLIVTIWLFVGDTLPNIKRSYERDVSSSLAAEQVEVAAREAAGPTPQQEARHQRAVERFEQRVQEAVTVRSPVNSLEVAGRILVNRSRRGLLEPFWSLEKLVSEAPELIYFMLFGVFLFQIGFFGIPLSRRAFFLPLAVASGIVGFGPIFQDWFLETWTPTQNALATFFYLFPLSLDMAYISVVALLLSYGWSARVLNCLAPAGKMAFTNYVLHWALPPVLFPMLFGWWLPGVGKAENLAKVTVVFALMVLLSNWWLKRFRFGPFEWLWRSLTYWKLQPMRV